MSHYTPGAAGSIRGKMGQTVFSSWRGIKTAKAASKKSFKKASANQLTQRSKIGILSHFLSQFKDVIAIGFPVNRNKSYGWDAAVKFNARNAMDTMGEVKVDFSKVQFSQGTLEQVNTPEMSLEGDQIYVDWLNPQNLNLGVSDQDTLHCCCYGIKKDGVKAMLIKNVAQRGAGDFRLSKKIIAMARTVHVWIFLVSADGKTTSNSKYLGSLKLV